MKSIIWVVAVVAAAVAMVAIALLALQSQRGIDCPDRVLIVRGHAGAPIECVCLEGVLSTCFEPGP